jgi:predicted Holliday junction resolvase-like endonuclease
MDFITIVLIGLIVVVSIYLAYIIGKSKKDKEWKEMIPAIREDAIKRSRAVIGGQFSEQLAPYLPNFKYKPTECKFIGKPIDFIVFEGSDEKEITEVVFVEVKSGNSRLSIQEKNLKNAIEKGKIRYEEYRVPKEIVK